MRPLALGLLAALALVPQAEALQMTKKAIRNPGIFGIKIARTDMAFYGRADAILSISFQEYTTGSFIVAEVVIDMKDSNQQLRLYAARPPGTADVANRANRASEANSQNRGLDPSQASKLPIPSQLAAVESKVNNMISGTTGDIVVKTYPTTMAARERDVQPRPVPPQSPRRTQCCAQRMSGTHCLLASLACASDRGDMPRIQINGAHAVIACIRHHQASSNQSHAARVVPACLFGFAVHQPALTRTKDAAHACFGGVLWIEFQFQHTVVPAVRHIQEGLRHEQQLGRIAQHMWVFARCF